MKYVLPVLAALALLVVPAQADVILDPHLSGTGDNVIFDSVSGNIAVGHLNGQHVDVVDFTNLGNTIFSGAANGNDIKITNTNDLKVQVFDPTNTFVVGTFTQVFSLKGDGHVFLSVIATDGTFNFDLGTISPSAQSGFTLSAINGEVMTSMTLLDVGGTITDFEHYRIDVAPLAVPGPVAGAGIPGLIAACGVIAFAKRRRRQPVTS
jgi:hypothetical protein